MMQTTLNQSSSLRIVPEGLTITGDIQEGYEEILSPAALRFLMALHRHFDESRKMLLQKRTDRQAKIDDGELPGFAEETREIRDAGWQVSPIPADLIDRRVEITGPVDRKMIINALNSGAKVFMADFEDSNTPSWQNVLEGQINLRDAVNRTISFENTAKGKTYQLNELTATLMVRPRGWHLTDQHILVDGSPISGSLMDFGLYFFHNAKWLIENGSGPYFYLPKLESHQEARLWNDVFLFAQDYIGIPKGTIKATVLIETILASFEMNEILYELREHSAGLNCGRWDYIFSYIKKFRNYPYRLLPDRAQVTMQVPFMEAYSKLVIKTCHRRNVHAMGGMAAQIPIKNNEEANKKAMNKVKQDKLTEVKNGHDGTWVAHPGLVQTAMQIFDEFMPGPNQIDKQLSVDYTAADLLALPEGEITEEGIRQNINVGIQYIESWLRGNGAAAINHLMEDAATAEISRAQVWQCLKNKAQLSDGRTFSAELYTELLHEESEKIKATLGSEVFETGRFSEAIKLFDELVRAESFEEFLTLPAYNLLDN
ncbi:MAG: malate synthase A [Cyclobacteriaceae bacterium]